MAIQFARARYISRSSGGNAVRSAAYNARTAIAAERTGELSYFRHRDAPEHHEVLLPQGAAARFAEFDGVVERRRSSREAPGRTGRARDRRGPAGRCRDQRRGPARTGASASPSSILSPRGWRCSSTYTRRMKGEAASDACQLACASADYDPAARVWGEVLARPSEPIFPGTRSRAHGRSDCGPPGPAYRAGADAQGRIGDCRPRRGASARPTRPRRAIPTQVLASADPAQRDVHRARPRPHLAKHLADEVRARRDEGGRCSRMPDLLPLYDRESGEAAGRFTPRGGAGAGAGGARRGRRTRGTARPGDPGERSGEAAAPSGGCGRISRPAFDACGQHPAG